MADQLPLDHADEAFWRGFDDHLNAAVTQPALGRHATPNELAALGAKATRALRVYAKFCGFDARGWRMTLEPAGRPPGAAAPHPPAFGWLATKDPAP